jgi:hypothetical protein
MTDLPALPLLKGPVHLKDALDEDDDMLAQLRYPQQKKEFFDYLMTHKVDIENLVRCHLGIDRCHVCVMEIWKSGSFNVAIPILIPATSRRAHDKVFVRFPLRSEIGGYIWLQEQCPDVSIPILHGFGLPDGQCVS